MRFILKISFLLGIVCTFTLLNCKSSNSKERLYYVSPSNTNTHDRAIENSYSTLNEALKASRKHSGKKRIVVASGNYYNVNLKLTQKDSELSIEGNKENPPHLFGGILIKNWKKEGKFIYADVKGTSNRKWDFRMIQVNGSIRERSRLPEKGAFTHLNHFNVRWLSSEAGGWERKPTTEEKTMLHYIPENIPENIDVNNAEITIYHEWNESLVGLKSHNVEKHILEFENASQHPPGAFAKRNKNAQTYVVWNTKSGMKKPGQWYLDRTQERLYYWPKNEEHIQNIEVVVPTVQNILSLEYGTSDIDLKNLNISSTTTKLVTGGYGARNFEGAIHGNHLKNITLENVNFKNIGGWAIKLRGKNINIHHSEIYNCGAGAIFYSGNQIQIHDNKLHDIGCIYKSAVGILGQGNKNTIRKNEIYNMPYCGINGIGHNSLIDSNVIYNIKTFMQDGGAVYMFGHKNTIVKNNVTLSKQNPRIKMNAYYLDEGCNNCIVENNISYNAFAPVLAHMTRNCTYRNNIFIDKKMQTISYANSNNLTFDKNILIADTILFKGPSKNSPEKIKEKLGKVMNSYSSSTGISSWKKNIFHSRKNTILHEELAQYKAFQMLPLKAKEGTLFTNPKLTGISTGKLNYENSNSENKTILLNDFSNVGCKTNLEQLISEYYLND